LLTFARLFIHLILVQNKVHQTTFFFAKKICDIFNRYAAALADTQKTIFGVRLGRYNMCPY